MDQNRILPPPVNWKAFSSPAGGRHSFFYSCAPSPLGWVYWSSSAKLRAEAHYKAEAGSAVLTHPQNTSRNSNCRALQLPTILCSVPGPDQNSFASILDSQRNPQLGQPRHHLLPQQQSRDTKLPGVWQSQAGDQPDAHSFPHHSVPFFPCCSVTQHPRTSLVWHRSQATNQPVMG